MELKDKLNMLVNRRKELFTQEQISKMTGVSRSHISNFENGRVNNMYLYDFYMNHFDEVKKHDTFRNK